MAGDGPGKALDLPMMILGSATISGQEALGIEVALSVQDRELEVLGIQEGIFAELLQDS